MSMEEGWVSIDEIQNVWCEAIRKLEMTVYPPGSSPHRSAIISFFESVKYELYNRSKAEKQDRVQQYNYSGPDPEQSGAKQDEERGSASSDPSDINRERWKERTQLGRMYAMEGSGGKDE